MMQNEESPLANFLDRVNCSLEITKEDREVLLKLVLMFEEVIEDVQGCTGKAFQVVRSASRRADKLVKGKT